MFGQSINPEGGYMKTRKRVYVAGPYSCEGRCKPLGVDLEYMRKGLEASVKIFKMGYAPFCPWLDYLFQFVSGGAELERKDYYEFSMAWLEVADMVYVIELREHSYGTQAEIDRAIELGIPVVYTLKKLEEVRDGI